MDALLFAKAAREEKDAMLETYLNSTDSMAGEQIAKLKAAGASDELLREVFDSVLTDCFYNILLGIDGQMPIGSLGERSYRLLAPDSTVIANASGTLAEAAYEAFYGEGTDALALRKMGVLAVEMEAAALYMNAALTGKSALAICTISDHTLTGESLPAEERQNSFLDMIRLGLEIA